MQKESALPSPHGVLLYQKSPGIECAIARCWAFCGPHLPLDAHFAIGNFIGNVLGRERISIQGDGTPRRSYLYGADLAIWLWTMLFRAPSLTPINVGSDEDVSILELAQKVAQTLDPGYGHRCRRLSCTGRRTFSLRALGRSREAASRPEADREP